MMTINKRMVFLSGAIFNWAVGGSFFVAYPLVQPVLELAPMPDSLRVFSDLFAVMVIGFGVAYYLLSIDFERYRPFAGFGAAMKLAVVAVSWGHFFAGHISWRVPVLSLMDLVYAVLFIAILRDAGPDNPA